MRKDDVVIDPRDKKYFVHKPDASFSPQRNAAIIQEVHDDTRKFHKKLWKAYEEGLGERTEILAHFADYKFNRGGDKNFEGYVGKNLRTQLVGERLLEKVRVLSTVDRMNGYTKVKI